MRPGLVFSAALSLTGIGPHVAASQDPWRLSANELVAVFVRELDSAPSAMAWQTLAAEVRRPRSQARTDSILRALLPIAKDNGRPRAQQEAIALLGWGASHITPAPRAWVAQALVALYWDLDQTRPVARATALDAFAQLADTGLGQAMLRRVLTLEGLTRREREAAARAALRSPRGQALLRDLDRSDAIRDPWVRALVKWWLERREGRQPPA